MSWDKELVQQYLLQMPSADDDGKNSTEERNSEMEHSESAGDSDRNSESETGSDSESD
jgi:hypothetical protein